MNNIVELRWPEVREQLLSVLDELADERNQNIWLGHEERSPMMREPTRFGYLREVLFDQHDFDRPACVGEILYVEDEREALLEPMDVLYSIDWQ